MEFDASPWGGGAVLLRDCHPVPYFRIVWTKEHAVKLGLTIGDPAGQTTWEFVTLLVALVLWGGTYRDVGLALLGDNIAALGGAANLRGRGSMVAVSRELAWRQVRYGWRYAVGHLPAEMNITADSLSRLAAPEGSDRKEFPANLANIPEVLPPTCIQLFVL